MLFSLLLITVFPLTRSCLYRHVYLLCDISITFSHFPHRKYTVIDSPEQRQRYKNDFNAEYSEYRGLHARIEGITRQFTVLDNELKQLHQGTDKYKVDSLKDTQNIIFVICNWIYWLIILTAFYLNVFLFVLFVCFLFTDNPQSDTWRVS